MAFARDAVRFRFTLPEQRVRVRTRPWWLPERVYQHLLRRISLLALRDSQRELQAREIGRLDRWTLQHLVWLEQRADDHGSFELIDWP